MLTAASSASGQIVGQITQEVNENVTSTSIIRRQEMLLIYLSVSLNCLDALVLYRIFVSPASP